MKSATVLRRRDKIIPLDYLSLLTEKLPINCGCVVVSKGKDNTPQIDTSQFQVSTETEMDAEGLNVTQEMFPNGIIAFRFSDTLAETDELQPFPVLKEKDKILISGLLSGEFKEVGGVVEDLKRGREFFVAYRYLVPKVAKLYRLVGNDLGKLIMELRDDTFKQEMEAVIGDQGSITLLCQNEEVITFDKSETTRDYDWGWTTNHFGYGNVAAVQAPPEKKGMFSFGAKKTTTEPPAAAAGTKLVEATTNESPPWEEELIGPPAEALSKNALKTFYRQSFGMLPDKYETRPKIAAKFLRKNSRLYKEKYQAFADLKDSKTLQAAVAASAAANAAAAKTTPIPGDAMVTPKPKDLEPKHIASVTPITKTGSVPAVASVIGEPLPLLSAQQVDVVDKVLKALDLSGQQTMDPGKILELENKVPSFAEKLKLKGLQDTFGWNSMTLTAIGKAEPKALALLAMNYRSGLLRLMAALPKTKPEEEVVEDDLVHEKPPETGQRRRMML